MENEGNSKYCDFVIFRVGFEVFTAVVLKSIFFWDMTPLTPRKIPGTHIC
jgi:hypothetical protein